LKEAVMGRPVSLVVCAALACAVTAGADEDAVGKRLAAAKDDFQKATEKARSGLLADLKKREETVQKAGDLNLLLKVQAEKKAFEESGLLPKTVPVKAYEAQLAAARGRLEDGYGLAVKQYTMDGKIDLAKAAQQELDEFKKRGTLAAAAPAGDPAKAKRGYDALATGTWKKLLPDAAEFARLRNGGAVAGTADFRDGVLTCNRGALSTTPQALGAKNALVRAKVLKPNFVPGTNASLALRVIPNDDGTTKFFASAWCNGDGTYGIGRGGAGVGGWKDLVTCKLEPRKDYFEFAFAVVGESMTAYVDGKRVLETTYRVPFDDAGGVRVAGLGAFKAIEVQLLDR
jgi:hypothetical protein